MDEHHQRNIRCAAINVANALDKTKKSSDPEAATSELFEACELLKAVLDHPPNDPHVTVDPHEWRSVIGAGEHFRAPHCVRCGATEEHQAMAKLG